MDRIEAIRAFLAVAQEGSFTGGARRLGLSTKLVSKRVAALEARLGAQLFARTTRSVSLTDAGQAYRDRAGGLIDQFDELDATLRARQDTLAGQIRITAPTGFGSHPLPDALAPFIEQNRQVEVQLLKAQEFKQPMLLNRQKRLAARWLLLLGQLLVQL